MSEETINLADWYTPEQAAARLSKNSGKPIGIDYPRNLARQKKVRTTRLSTAVLYWKPDIDAYVVKEPGRPAKQEKGS